MIYFDVYTDDKYKEVEYANGNTWEGIKCKKFDGHQRAGKRTSNLKINLNRKTYGDFLWSLLSDCIITEKVAEILKVNKITGYKLNPVEIVKGKANSTLYELVVTGNGGEAKNESGIYLKEECKYCGLKIYSAFRNGIIVNEKNWDGSDIFTVVGYPGHILVIERVKELIEKNKLTGVKFTPAHELKWPNGVIKP